MRRCKVLAIWGAAALVFVMGAMLYAEKQQAWSEFPMKFMPAKGDLNYTTPRGHEFGAISQNGQELVIPLPFKGKSGIAAVEDKNSLMVDGDGDGRMETKIVAGRPGFVTAKIVYDDETIATYMMKVQKGDQKKGGGWVFQRNCSMSGKVSGVALTIIDDNNNGKYDDYGLDSFIVGSSTYAAPLSKVVNLGGKLFELSVNESGTMAKVKPFVGETGCVDLVSGYKCVSKLQVAVVQCGQNFFDVMASPQMLVPAGSYKMVWGMISNGKQSAMIQTGKMAVIEVTNGGTAKANWGMPVRLEVSFTMSGGKLTVGPSNIKAFGAANEEYVNFYSKGLKPQVEVQDKTGKTIGKGAIVEPC